MATKVLEVVVCDLPHKHDRPAVGSVTIDVCATHMRLFEVAEPGLIKCTQCGRSFKGEHGLRMHTAKIHKRLKAV